MNNNEINYDEINNDLLSNNNNYEEYIERSSLQNLQEYNINKKQIKLSDTNNDKILEDLDLDLNSKDDLIDFFNFEEEEEDNSDNKKRKRRKMKP